MYCCSVGRTGQPLRAESVSAEPNAKRPGEQSGNPLFPFPVVPQSVPVGVRTGGESRAPMEQTQSTVWWCAALAGQRRGFESLWV